MTYEFGDFVVYEPFSGRSEIGRVTEDRGDTVFVCYHQGCTAASTPKEYLRFADYDEIEDAPIGIGYHRFDSTCPDRVDEYCYNCKAKLVV